MTTRFSDWFDKIVGKNSNKHVESVINPDDEEKTVSEFTEAVIKSSATQIEHEIRCNKDNKLKQDYMDYVSIKKNVQIGKVQSKVKEYDAAKQQNDPNYKSMAYYMEHEVEEDDVNEDVDEAMEADQKRKLGVQQEAILSEQRKKELEEQELRYKKLRVARENLVQMTRGGVSHYDSVQTKEGYKSYEETCRENDEISDPDEDDEMDRVLQEKLGIYNERTETDEVRQKRAKKQAALDLKLKSERQHRQERMEAVGKSMDNYHEQNKSRADYGKFGGD